MDHPPLVNLNGNLIPTDQAQVSLLDHGLLYGDGLFETIRIESGKIFRIDLHLSRLRESAERLGLPLPWDDPYLEASLRITASAGRLTDGVLRLTITRGVGPPIPDPSVCTTPTFFITVRPWKSAPNTLNDRAISLGIKGRHPRTWIPGIKSLSYLPFQMARTEAKRCGFDEALLTWDDQVVEASTSNVFAVIDGVLHTPELESGCLPGTMRATIIEISRDLRIPLLEISIRTEQLLGASEVFLTNSVSRIIPASQINHKSFNRFPGTITEELDAALQLYIRKHSS